MKPVLRQEWVERIFSRLLGIYGAQFKAKFSHVANGVDVGLENAKTVWAEELGTFHDNPEAILHALQNLPSDYAPNAIEFRELCRHAPRKEVPALTHTPTPEEIERSRIASQAVGKVMQQKIHGGIDTHWATHPRSYAHMKFILDAANNDARFKPCIAEMVSQGICTAEGKLLKRYAGPAQWVKA